MMCTVCPNDGNLLSSGRTLLALTRRTGMIGTPVRLDSTATPDRYDALSPGFTHFCSGKIPTKAPSSNASAALSIACFPDSESPRTTEIGPSTSTSQRVNGDFHGSAIAIAMASRRSAPRMKKTSIIEMWLAATITAPSPGTTPVDDLGSDHAGEAQCPQDQVNRPRHQPRALPEPARSRPSQQSSHAVPSRPVAPARIGASARALVCWGRPQRASR